MPRARKSSAVIAAAAIMSDREKKKSKVSHDVPEEADAGPPAWIDKVVDEVRAMIAENLTQIEACASTNPDNKIRVSLAITLDLLELEGSAHLVKMRYASRPFVDERVVGGGDVAPDEDS